MKLDIKCEMDIARVYALVGNGKGGVGKSFFCQALIEYWQLRGFLPRVAQVDSQARLEELNKFEILTIPSDPQSMRRDPSEQLGRFREITNRLVVGPHDQPFILDTGANEEQNVSFWMRQSEFYEELEEFDRLPVLFIVFTSEQESIEKAGQTAQAFAAALPDAHLVLVENRRFGRIESLHRESDAYRAYLKWIAPLEVSASTMVMPAILGQSYARFEASRTRFSDVVGMKPTEIMELTGFDRADAKIARGDVANWLATMFTNFDALFGQEFLLDD